MNLAVADIDGDDMTGATRQQHLGETTGRSTDIETVETGRIEAEMLKRCFELQRRARNVGLHRIVDFDQGVAGNGAAGFGDGLAVDLDGAALDGVARPRAAGNEATAQEELVEACGG